MTENNSVSTYEMVGVEELFDCENIRGDHAERSLKGVKLTELEAVHRLLSNFIGTGTPRDDHVRYEISEGGWIVLPTSLHGRALVHISLKSISPALILVAAEACDTIRCRFKSLHDGRFITPVAEALFADCAKVAMDSIRPPGLNLFSIINSRINSRAY